MNRAVIPSAHAPLPARGRGWVRGLQTVFEAPSPNLSPSGGEEHDRSLSMPRIAPPNRPTSRRSPPNSRASCRPACRRWCCSAPWPGARASSPRSFAGGLLDKGPLSLRQREIVIDRTTARLGCEYEWGVHIALFAERVGFTRRMSPPRYRTRRRRLLDAGRAGVDRPGRRPGRPSHHRRGTWAALAAHFDETQILEAIALVGYYHTISFLCRGLELPLETYAARFPATGSLRSR